MIQLVLIYCLVGTPTTCTESRPVIDDLSLMSCPLAGQEIGARFVADHPRWFLSRTRCEIGRPAESQT